MKEIVLSPPMFGFVVATRAMIGVGVGLLLSSRIPEGRRRRIALALIGIGAVTTIPAARSVFGDRARRYELPG